LKFHIFAEFPLQKFELANKLNFPKTVPSCSKISEMREALLEILADGDLVPDIVRLGKREIIRDTSG
jgi:hypothetical protein